MNRQLVWRCLNKLHILRVTLALFLILALCALPQPSAAQETSQTSSDEIYNLITNYHVSGVTENDLKKSGIEEMISNLDDPYTQYFSKETWGQFENQLENNYVGIGIRIALDEEGVFVDEVFPDSPAEQAKLIQEDYIIAVEGQIVKGWTLEQVVSKVTGPEGTSVQLTVKRGNEIQDISVKRAEIQLPALTSRWFNGGIGYIQIPSFSSHADQILTALLQQWQANSMKALVLDLRNNPGGYLESAVQISGHFIKEGVLIHTVDRFNNDVPVYVLKRTQPPISVPVIVLVNQFSASASEVLTGALQDYNVATVVGTQTFGKGSVQSLFALSDGGYLKMTIQEYTTPLKRKVNQVGLQPDVEIYGNTAQFITALHLAGMEKIQVTLGKHKLWVNEVELNEMVKTITVEGKTYVPSRLAAAIVDGEIQWDHATKSISVENEQAFHEFIAADGGLKIEHGASYVRLDLFEKAFSEFQWHKEQDKVILETVSSEAR